MTSNPLVEVKKLKKYFSINSPSRNPFQKDQVRAIDGVDLEIFKGETLGLVGESGCGKTTLGRCIIKLIDSTSGEIFFDSRNIFNLFKREMRFLRKNMQIIFQDPFSSLDPRMKVGEIVGQPLNVFSDKGKGAKKEMISQLLEAVGLDAGIVNVAHHYGSVEPASDLLEMVDAYAKMDGTPDKTNRAIELMGTFCQVNRKQA